jgi:anaerobic magnesium-protoporphyrin IX monomethyl ester cyclase
MKRTLLLNLYRPAKKSEFVPPLGLLYLLGGLERSGYPVEFRDLQFELYTGTFRPESLAEAIAGDVDVVGISFMCDMLPLALLTARALKALRPDIVVIFGGSGSGGLEEQIIANFPFVDLIVVGEGDHTMPEVMDCLDNGLSGDLRKIPGIVYREQGIPITTGPRSRIESLDQLPLPAYHRLESHRYAAVNIATGRGCPFSCTYCSTASYWGRKNITRSTAAVVEEIKWLHDSYGFKIFNLSDDTFTLNRNRVSNFCHQLKNHGLDIRWNCYGNINTLDETMLEQMRDCGCRTVYIGTESGSDSILDLIKKNMRVRDIVRVLSFAKDIMEVRTHFIWGFPFEPLDDFYLTVMLSAYLEEMGVKAFLTPLIPLPMAPMYQQYKDSLVFSLDKSFSKFNSSLDNRDWIELVNRHPECFPMFFSFNTPGLEEKLDIIGRLNQWPD